MLYLGGRSFLREIRFFTRGGRTALAGGEEKRLGRVRPGTAEGGCPILGGGGGGGTGEEGGGKCAA